MEAIVRDGGALPATIGILEGRAVIGLSEAELKTLATNPDVIKVSSADIAAVIAGNRLGATTVAGTLALAMKAGIRVVATGGLGGVHRWGDGENTFDVSADLTELARSPVALVSAGVKSVLDLPRTLEVLETLGVPVVGYGTDEFPAFYSRESGLGLHHRVDSPEDAARLMRIHMDLGCPSGILFANPPCVEHALDRSKVEGWLAQALGEATEQGITGKTVTPYLLGQLARLSHGRTVETNVAVLEGNAKLAAKIAIASLKSRD